MRRLAVLVTIVAIATLAMASPALAAAPTNDTYAGRTVIGALPFSETLDTTAATTDADDVEANANCGAPATEASVWYELTASADGAVLVDVSASDYSAGVIVVTGSPGSFTLVNCGPQSIGFSTVGGETYGILAFDDTPANGNGGMLTIDVEEAPPPPVVSLTVDPIGHFNKLTGSATVTGTVTCTGVPDFAVIDVQLSQKVGRVATVTGFGEGEFTCDGTTQSWSVEVFPQSGLFKGGQAASVAVAFACDFFSCGEDEVDRTIKLRA